MEFPKEVEAAIHRHGKQQIALERISREANTSRDLTSLLRNSLDETRHALGADYCHILKHLSVEDELLLIAWTGGCEAKEGTYVPSSPATLPGFVINSMKKGHFANFWRRSKLGSPSLPGSRDAKSGVSALISIRQAPYGVIEAYSDQANAFNAEDMIFLESASNILAAAIDHYRVEEEYRRINDILERQVSGRSGLVHLFREVMIVANEAASIPEVMNSILNSICVQTGWPVGHVFLAPRGEGEALQSTPWWFLKDPVRYRSFQVATEEIVFHSGEGLPGHVYAARKPIWVKDVGVDLLFRVDAMVRCGLSSAFAFPVMVDQEVIAVLELFSDEIKEPDYLLLDGLATMGVQLGRIVERLRNLEDLRSKEQKLLEAQKIARLGSWEWDIKKDQVYWSETLYDIFGISPAEFAGTFEGFFLQVHPDDREILRSVVSEAYRNAGTFEIEHRIILPGGEIRYLRAKGRLIADESGQPVKMIGTGQDITERKRIDDELRAKEEMLRNVVTGTPIIFWAVNRDGIVTVVEGKALEKLGVKPGTNTGKSIHEIMPADLPLRKFIERALAGEEVIQQDTVDFGTFETRYTPIWNEQGEVIGMTGLSVDITSRIQAETALRESEARFRTIFRSSPNGLALLDMDGKFLLSNPTLEAMLGYEPVEMKGLELMPLIHPRDRIESASDIDRLFTGKDRIFKRELRFLRKDGQRVWANLLISPVRNPEGSPELAVLMAEDISNRKQMEAELAEIQRRMVDSREKERLELAQELHDEPLQELYGLIYQINTIREMVPDPAATTEINEVEKNLNNVISILRTICGQLRPPTLTSFGLEGAIREHADRFQSENQAIQLQLDLMYDGQTLPDHTRLALFRIYQQALSNVVRHANATMVTVRFRYDESQAELEIEDNGNGFEMPPRMVDLVREGHYGLAGAAERVEMISGHLNVRSIRGRGTHIQVLVPLTSTVAD